MKLLVVSFFLRWSWKGDERRGDRIEIYFLPSVKVEYQQEYRMVQKFSSEKKYVLSRYVVEIKQLKNIKITNHPARSPAV